MAAPKKRIELLPKEDWEKSSFGKILKWTLNVGRYIVIVTELVVILAFLSRFKLDHDLTDLYEEIKRKQALIEAGYEFEEEFRFLQEKLTNIEKLEQKQEATSHTLDKILPLIPLEVALASLDIDGNQINLKGVALSEQGLAGLINNLKASPQFKKISLPQVTTGSEEALGIKFELSCEFQDEHSLETDS